MKKITLLLLLALSILGAKGQTQYQLNYGLIRYGLLNGTSVHSVYGQVDLKHVGLGAITDSILTVLNGRIRKIPVSGVVSAFSKETIGAGFLQSTNNPMKPYGIESSIIQNGTSLDMWYRTVLGTQDTVKYAVASNSTMDVFGASVNCTLNGGVFKGYFPYVKKVGSKYVMTYVNVVAYETRDLFMASSTDKINWTSMNSGNAVLTHSVTTTNPLHNIFNPAIELVGSNYHLLVELKSNIGQFQIHYSYADSTTLNFNTNLSTAPVIALSGNPDIKYIPSKNSLFAIYGSRKQPTGEPWIIKASYVSLASTVSDSTNWIISPRFPTMQESGISLADPYLAEISGNSNQKLVMSYNYNQVSLSQAYNNSYTLTEFFNYVTAPQTSGEGFSTTGQISARELVSRDTVTAAGYAVLYGLGNNLLKDDGTRYPIASVGTVTSVNSANSDIGVATGTTTPVLTLASGTGTGSLVRAVSPTFTGIPSAPTATAGTNTTQLATTAFVTAADALKANDNTVVHLAGIESITGAKTFVADVQIPAIPVNATSAASKSYIDNLITGITWKAAVKTATTANITLSGVQTIDAISVIAGDRVLVKNQTLPADNGIYLVAAGAWTRALDADSGAEIETATVAVTSGTINGDTQWTCTATGITLGSTAITFGQISGAGTYAASTGLTLTGNVFAIDATVATLTGTQTLTNKTLVAPALGTPVSGVATNLTGLPLTTGVTGILPVLNGGTGSATKNFVDLTTAQTIAGIKTLSSDIVVNGITVGRGSGSIATNTALGSNAILSGTSAYENTALGFKVLESATTAYDNTGVGVNALQFATTAFFNTALGVNALRTVTLGSNNTALGLNSGGGITTGSGNTILGANTTGLAAGLTNNIILANGTGSIKAQHDGTNWTMQGTVTATTFIGALTGNATTATTATSATTAGTVTTAAQPAISSVGTLTGLAVSGAGSFGSGIIVSGSSLNTYVDAVNGNTLNFSYNTNATEDGWINYKGYLGGITQFRNLNIGDGKNGQVAAFTGSTKAATFFGALTAPSVTLSTTPTTSAGTADILTRNTSTGVIEKISSASGGVGTTTNNITNITSSGAGTTYYQRNGSIVSFSVDVVVTPAGAGPSQVDFSLPVASNFTSISRVKGAISLTLTAAATNYYIGSDIANDRINLFFNSVAGGALTFNISGHYIIE